MGDGCQENAATEGISEEGEGMSVWDAAYAHGDGLAAAYVCPW